MNKWMTLLVLTGIICIYVVYHQSSIQMKDKIENEFENEADDGVQTQKTDKDSCAQAPDAYSYYYGLEGFEVDYKKAVECNDLSGNTDYSFAIMIMAYANGYGVERNINDAIEWAKGDIDAAPAAIEYRLKTLKKKKEACSLNPKGKECTKPYDYFSSSTSGMASRFMKDLGKRRTLGNHVRKLKKEYSQLGKLTQCLIPKVPSINQFKFKYKLLSDEQILIYNQSKKFTLNIKGVADALKDRHTMAKELIYIDQYKYRILFPYIDITISYEGSGGYLYTYRNWYALNEKLGDKYVFKISNAQGNLVYFWDLGGQYGDSIIALDLNTGQSKVIGNKSYYPAQLTLENQSTHTQVDYPLELGYEMETTEVFELKNGIGIRLSKDQKLLRIVNPVTGELGVCRLTEALLQK